MASRKDWAQYYRERFGWSIIPVGEDKRPLIKSWKEYQKIVATKEQIDRWWTMWPDANMAVITGQISGISVIDIDCYKMAGTLDYVKALFWDNVSEATDIAPWQECLIAITPRGGFHWFFNYNSDLTSRMVAPNVDVKSDGGYVLIAPSECNNNRYRWIRPPWTEDKEIRGIWSKATPFSLMAETTEVGQTLPDLPVTESPTTAPEGDRGDVTPLWANRLISFEQGGRDETLFHIANTLILGGMPVQNVELVINNLAEGCNPPFKGAGEKIISALQRGQDRLRPLAQEIRDWLSDIEGVFTSRQIDAELRIVSKGDKRNRRQILNRLKEDGLIEQFQIAGKYRKVTSSLSPMNFMNAAPTTRYDAMKFPLGEHELFLPMEKNIIIVTGSPDAGKTAWLMDFLRLNQDLFDIDYFCSDMGELELKSRLEKFPTMSLEDWKFNAYEQESDFHDVIKPNGVSVVDFLEMHDNFYLVAQKIYQIWDKLDKGLCIIALQKNPNTMTPLGGQRAMEKARMVVNLDFVEKGRHKALFSKCKNWRTPENPRGLSRRFWIQDGCQFVFIDPLWEREEEDD
jgi:hypothetical protein